MRHLVARIDSLTHFVRLILFTFLLIPLILHAFSVDSVRIHPYLTVHHASLSHSGLNSPVSQPAPLRSVQNGVEMCKNSKRLKKVMHSGSGVLKSNVLDRLFGPLVCVGGC